MRTCPSTSSEASAGSSSVRRLDMLKRELEVRFDFSPYAAFKTIDRCQDGALTSCNMTLFLRGQGFYPTEREVLSIIRRMDTSCAATVSYTDFSDFLRGHGSADSCTAAELNSSGGKLRA
jgi:Ca2+-binding EF-hand superfamily protein